MTVTALKPAEPVRRSPGRQRMAEISARLADLRTRSARLREPSSVRQAAEAALPAAMQAHAAAAQEADLSRGTRGQSQADKALEAARKRVLELRQTLDDTPDHSAELATLDAEAVQLGGAHRDAHRAALREAIEALTVEYHQHARRALIAERALQAIQRYTAYQIDAPDLAVLAANATQLSPEPRTPECAGAAERLKAILGEYGDRVQAWCGAILSDPDAFTEPMAAVAARMPHRPEETTVEESADAA